MRLALLATAFFVPALAACLISHDDHGGGPPPPPGTAQPLTVSIDTNQTMSHVAGGQGVGLFVQYAAGGHWRIRWTCDTALSGLACDFVVKMDGSSIANAKSVFDPSEQGATLDSTSRPDELVASSHTTSGVDEIDFDAAPGADLKIDLAVSGLRDGAFFFFVQNGQIDGNFPSSKLTDPLIFEPSAP